MCYGSGCLSELPDGECGHHGGGRFPCPRGADGWLDRVAEELCLDTCGLDSKDREELVSEYLVDLACLDADMEPSWLAHAHGWQEARLAVLSPDSPYYAGEREALDAIRRKMAREGVAAAREEA